LRFKNKNMKVPVYNQEGKEIKKIDIKDEIFNVEFNKDLVHQVVVSQMSNKRQSNAHTKDRSEVSGGGKKPWRQKGTGRARHGSIRSPLWKGGGITFGPRNDKNYKKIIPKKMRKTALFMSLSTKVKDSEIFIIENLETKDHKTKTFKQVFQKFPFFEKNSLIALPDPDKKIILGTRNISKIKTIQARNLTALDVLSSKYLVLTERSLEEIKK
jgi:large subunit ribosomal protein L4